jgi:hypothetical protein
MSDQDTRDTLIEIVGSLQLQTAMFHSLLEFLDDRGLLANREHDVLFDTAEFHIELAPDSPSRKFALQILAEWRKEGLLRGATRK